MTAETIVLPRSGLVLTRSDNLPVWSCGTKVGMVYIDGKRPVWSAYLDDARSPLHLGAREECVAALDSRVLALRAALLDGPGVREKAANALSDARLSYMAKTMRPMPRTEGELSQRYADAVLAALRDGGGK